MAVAYLVWNEDAEEGVVFGNYVDAIYASNGIEDENYMGVPTLGEQFRETYAENGDEVFPLKKIKI
jgi:hypothetical protein